MPSLILPAIIIMIAIVAVSVIYVSQQSYVGTMMEKPGESMTGNEEGESMEKDSGNAEMDDGEPAMPFAKNYYRYEPAAYREAVSEGKTVFLFFRANWCPLCNAQRPKILEAFNELNYQDVVGFEAHYNDDETTPSDMELAREFQVPYQDTKIILNMDGVVLKTQEHLEKDRVKSEITAARV